MKGISVNKAAEVCGGILNVPSDAEISGVFIDSRKITSGSMFVALKGERVDGHDYIEKAFELGASCCLAERLPSDIASPVIVVPDAALAMKKLAAYYRGMFDIPVIGVTGSVGKTTAKEMIASVLEQKYEVLKTEKNFNNELGVPLTLFRLEPQHEVAVVEMGISDFGEMSRLAEMVRPTMAVYTIIGHAHLERLHNRNGVLKAKTEMLDFMPQDGTVFLNGDDDMLSGFECSRHRVLYGTGENANVRAVKIKADDPNETCCTVICGEREIELNIPAYGKHMVYAALIGFSVGIALGLDAESIKTGIASYKTVGRRANVCDTSKLRLIDDCYNANPDSVKCGIDSLCEAKGRKLCILGDMLEMGDEKEALHRSIGEYAKNAGVDLVITTGELSRFTAEGAGETARHFDTKQRLIDALPTFVRNGDTVLVKASHSMGFDEISESLKAL